MRISLEIGQYFPRNHPRRLPVKTPPPSKVDILIGKKPGKKSLKEISFEISFEINLSLPLPMPPYPDIIIPYHIMKFDSFLGYSHHYHHSLRTLMPDLMFLQILSSKSISNGQSDNRTISRELWKDMIVTPIGWILQILSSKSISYFWWRFLSYFLVFMLFLFFFLNQKGKCAN